MNILRTFENNLEGAVDGLFARMFRSGLQPVELAKAIQRYQTNYQQATTRGVIVMNVFRFSLSPEDLDRFSSFTRSLQRELADVARATADQNGWRTLGPIRIEFERSEDIRQGTFELRGKAESADAAPRINTPTQQPYIPKPAAQAQPQPTANPQVQNTPVVTRSSSRITVRAIEGPDTGKTWVIEHEGVIGRLPECDITLTGSSVSRRHAKLTFVNNQWKVEDLNSTNGIKVNGQSTLEAILHTNDRLEVGGIVLSLAGV